MSQGISKRELLIAMFREALKRVDPYRLILSEAGRIRERIAAGGVRDVYVAGFGKASYPMALGLEEGLGDLIREGIIITKDGHLPRENRLRQIRACEASHPVPDERAVSATRKILELADDLDEDDLLICLTSGGGSALFVSPYEGLRLKEKQDITDLLLRAGAEISELNAVRKHLSAVKGGRFAERVAPAGIINLIISDVIGDALDVIASGPTAPDPTSYDDALKVLEKYNLMEKAPPGMLDFLKKGSGGEYPETPGPDAAFFDSVKNILVGTNRKALEGAADAARQIGYDTEILTDRLSGEVRDAAAWLFEVASRYIEKGGRPVCLISGGETTVKVTGKGKGGRNMELALTFALLIEGREGITLLSAGTDGTDGPTDAAGAIVDGDSISRGRMRGLDARDFLERNDSYNFFRETGDLLITGPTGTNVMDIQILIIQ
jgi:glycerate-2-kinase